MNAFTADLLPALRRLLARPGFLATAVLTLALGIGAVAAILTVYDAVFLKPLPFRDAERIVRVLRDQPPVSASPVSPPVLREWRDRHGGVFDAFGAFVPQTVSLTGAGGADRLQAYQVTPGYWQVFGQPLALGRPFDEADEQAGERVVVIGDALWRDRFGADASVIGQSLQLNGEAWTVVGVAEPGFRYPADAQVWLPTFLPANTAGRGSNSLSPVARLAPGVSAQQAQAALAAVTAWQAQAFPDDHEGLSVQVQPLRELVGATLRGSMALLLATAAMVLLIACANLAGLMLAQGQSRRQEWALRRALGAGSRRLLGQVLAEAVWIALFGTVLALAVVPLAVTGLLSLAPALLPTWHVPVLDLRIIAASAGLSLLTLALFAVWPARRAAWADPLQAMQGASRSQTGSRQQARARSVLVSGQIALAMVLLVGAGLLIASLQRLAAVESGLAQPQRVLTAGISLPAPVMAPGEELQDWFARGQAVVAPRLDALQAALAALPGVESVAFSEALPASGQSGWNGSFDIPGRDLPEQRLVEFRFVSPDYFRTFGIPVIAGRSFTQADGGDSVFPRQALVNQAFVDRYLGGDDALGEQVSVFDGSAKTLIGVVGNVRQQGLHRAPPPEIYFPLRTAPVGNLMLALRSAGTDAGVLAASLQSTLAAQAPDTPVFAVRTLAEVTAGTLALRRFNMSLMSAFAATALALAAVGLYGLVAWSTGQRRREIGVRQSLGASAGDIWRLVLGDGLRLVLPGLVLGIAGALALARLLASQLYGVGAADPAVIAPAAGVLVLVALIACAVPTARAARIPPATALQ